MTWAEAISKGECSVGEFSVAFEQYKFNVYRSLWNDGTEFYDCLQKFLQSDFVKIWTEPSVGE